MSRVCVSQSFDKSVVEPACNEAIDKLPRYSAMLIPRIHSQFISEIFESCDSQVAVGFRDFLKHCANDVIGISGDKKIFGIDVHDSGLYSKNIRKCELPIFGMRK